MTRLPPAPLGLHYRDLLGKAAWQRIHPSIRRRFSFDQTAHYQGMMSEVYLSFFGRFLAYFCRFIGTPLAYLTGRDIPTNVKVYFDNDHQGYAWDRFYHFPKTTIRVKSTKCIREKEGLIECLEAGFGMLLKARESDGRLEFISRGYFWQWKNIRINIPRVFEPGTTVVRQSALTDRRFLFELTLTHPIFGVIAKQVGKFQ